METIYRVVPTKRDENGYEIEWAVESEVWDNTRHDGWQKGKERFPTDKEAYAQLRKEKAMTHVPLT